MWWSWPCGSIALNLLTGHSVYKSIRSSILSHDSCRDLITAANKLSQFRQTWPRPRPKISGVTRFRLLRRLSVRTNHRYRWILKVTGRGRADGLEGVPPRLLSPWCREPSRGGWRSSQWSVPESRKLPGIWWAGERQLRSHTQQVRYTVRCGNSSTEETFKF